MEQRNSERTNRAFAVSVTSERHGQLYAIARNVSFGGMLVETNDLIPLGTPVHVAFMIPQAHSQIVMKGEVRHRFSLNFSTDGRAQKMMAMGIRFVEFTKNPISPSVADASVTQQPVFH